MLHEMSWSSCDENARVSTHLRRYRCCLVIADMDAISDEGLSAFLRMRARLFGIAYRVLGSAAEAEDIVQDVWIRWQTTDRTVVRDPTAFLSTTATRLAINVKQSARSRRETHVGVFPEPVDTSADPATRAERSQALDLAVLLLLERLSPAERAAYILREAFSHPYREIAHKLRIEEANARQLVTRARQHVSNGRSALGKLVVTKQLTGRSMDWTRSRRSAEKDIDHETRHHRRHRADWIEARHETEGRGP